MLGPITILKRPKTTAETVAEIRTHIAAVDALVNGISWNCAQASGYAEDVSVYLTNAQDAIENAMRSEDAWTDAAENARERDAVHSFLRSEKYL
jgi:hypothetical protein